MKAWKLNRLAGRFAFVDAPMPELRPGSVLIRVEAQLVISYLKAYVSDALKCQWRS